jgi:hypothetical protein
MLKHFDISYDEGKKNAAIAKICNFIFADVTNKVYRPTGDDALHTRVTIP